MKQFGTMKKKNVKCNNTLKKGKSYFIHVINDVKLFRKIINEVVKICLKGIKEYKKSLKQCPY